MTKDENDRNNSPAEDKLQDALTRLRHDVTRVEVWAGAMASFAKPPPDYDLSKTSVDRYRLPRSSKRDETSS